MKFRICLSTGSDYLQMAGQRTLVLLNPGVELRRHHHDRLKGDSFVCLINGHLH